MPTWNFLAAHLHGVPEILTDEENYRVLGLLVDRFEDRMPDPRRIGHSAEYARRIMKGTVGFRLTATRFTAKAKLSQNKPVHIAESVLAQLEGDGPYAQPALAAAMRAVRAARRG